MKSRWLIYINKYGTQVACDEFDNYKTAILVCKQMNKEHNETFGEKPYSVKKQG